MHTTPITRSQFLRGDWDGKVATIRPPWAATEPAFSARCEGCGKCIEACEKDILRLSARRLPRVDFRRGACSFCGLCAETCPTLALDPRNRPEGPPWNVRARVSDRCVAMRGTSCMSCSESCEHDAIESRPALGGRMLLRVSDALCTGCGACYAACPVDAIGMTIPSVPAVGAPARGGAS